MQPCRAVAVVILVSLFSMAQNSPEARVQTGFERIQASDLRADLTFLSSDALEGRMSLDRGSEVAIQFIAAEFAKAGLKPMVGNSYLQPIELIQFLPDTKQTTLVLRQGGKERHYEFMRDFYGFFPHDASVSAPVVFAGYGITAPEFNYDDYANLDVKGKIVLVFDHEPQETDPNSIFNGVGNTRHANARLKALNAQQHGAVGILIASEPNRKHPSNIERLSRIPGIVDRITQVPSQALADNEVNIPSFNISDDVAETLFSGASKKGSDLQSAIDSTLKPESMALPGTQIEMRVVNAEMRRGMTANVAGMIAGSDATLKNETIIFSAHYDHDGMRNGQIFHGADDNGSGTVGVIELARAFAANPAKPKRSIVFIVFAAEERGLLGSYYYAAHPLRPLATTRAVINFDMIGRNETPSAQTEGLMKIDPDTSNELNLIGTVNSPDYRAVVEHEDKVVGLHLNYKWDDDAALNVFQRSDQFPFALHDVPAMWWFTGFHPDYHQPTDTVEKINFVKMEKIVRLAYLSAWAFGDESSPPGFVAVTKKK
jgi:Zn-dependent M28 family amino/carboxypeptidase